MSKVLADVNVLGSLTSADDVVAPLDARGVVLIHWCGRLLSDTESFQKGLIMNCVAYLPLDERAAAAEEDPDVELAALCGGGGSVLGMLLDFTPTMTFGPSF